MTGIEALRDWITRVGDRKFMTNEWLFADDLKVYVRKGYHSLDDKMRTCLDIATIEVFDKGQGTFTAFLEAAKEMNAWDALFLECVQEPRLQSFLQRNGYIQHGELPAPNYYLLRNQ